MGGPEHAGITMFCFTQLRFVFTDGHWPHKKMFTMTHPQRNAHQNHHELAPHTSHSQRVAVAKKATNNKGEDVKTRKPFYTIGGNVN